METGTGVPCTRGRCLLRAWGQACSVSPLGCGGHSGPMPTGPGHPAAPSGLSSSPGAAAGGGGSRARGQPVQERSYWRLLCAASCLQRLGCQVEACVHTLNGEQGERPARPGALLLAAPLHSELPPAARLPSGSLCTDSEWLQGTSLAPVSLMLGPRVPLRDHVPPQEFGLQPPQRTKELKRLKNY